MLMPREPQSTVTRWRRAVDGVADCISRVISDAMMREDGQVERGCHAGFAQAWHAQEMRVFQAVEYFFAHRSGVKVGPMIDDDGRSITPMVFRCRRRTPRMPRRAPLMPLAHSQAYHYWLPLPALRARPPSVCFIARSRFCVASPPSSHIINDIVDGGDEYCC